MIIHWLAMNASFYINDINNTTLLPPAPKVSGRNGETNFSLDFARIANDYLQNTYMLHGVRKNVLLIFYSLVNIFGVFGNILFCMTFARKKSHRDPKCWLLINLSVSDMMICIICMPFSVIKLTHNIWIMGDFICKVVPFLQSLHIFASSHTIVAISIIRYLNVVKNYQKVTEKWSVSLIIGAIWLVSATCSVPMYVSHNVQQIYIHGGVFHYPVCLELWMSVLWRQRYTVFVFLLQFLIPFCLIFLFSVLICLYLRLRMTTRLYYKGIQNYKLIRTQKNTYLLSAVTVTYMVTWLPLALVNLLLDFDPNILDALNTETLQLLFATMLLISMTSTVINPILYGWFNGRFRKAILSLIKPQRNSSVNES